MVKLRGISINTVSQLDARRLPEYSTAHAFNVPSPVAACYIPIYQGSQIWFEYSIDGPHPPDAAYFFKLFMNGQVVTSWDCTAKHDYHGKAAYSLHMTKSSIFGDQAIVQQSFIFSTRNDQKSPRTKDDCIEIRVHRIKQRRRIRQTVHDTPLPKGLQGQGALRLVNGGLIELGRPARRYQYLLVDTQDEPYATFRFYCRTEDYLERHQILDIDRSLSPTSLATSESNYFNVDSPTKRINMIGDSPRDRSATSPQVVTTKEEEESSDEDRRTPTKLRNTAATFSTPIYVPREPLGPNIKDSVEELPSPVPRSPEACDTHLRKSPSRMVNELKHIPPSSVLLPRLVYDACSPTKASSPTVPEDLHVRFAGNTVQEPKKPIFPALQTSSPLSSPSFIPSPVHLSTAKRSTTSFLAPPSPTLPPCRPRYTPSPNPSISPLPSPVQSHHSFTGFRRHKKSFEKDTFGGSEQRCDEGRGKVELPPTYDNEEDTTKAITPNLDTLKRQTESGKINIHDWTPFPTMVSTFPTTITNNISSTRKPSLAIDTTTFNANSDRRTDSRPLSPFTRAGFLRRLTSNERLQRSSSPAMTPASDPNLRWSSIPHSLPQRSTGLRAASASAELEGASTKDCRVNERRSVSSASTRNGNEGTESSRRTTGHGTSLMMLLGRKNLRRSAN